MKPEPANRLAVRHILWITLGIALAISCSRILATLRFPIEAHFNNVTHLRPLSSNDLIVAAAYGCSVASFIVAFRSHGFWDSPGKTLSLLVASMCVIDWSLSLVAIAIVRNRLRTAVSVGITNENASILGFWYSNFAPAFGYLCSLPLLAFVIYRTRRQGALWRLAWVGFLCFAIGIVALFHSDFHRFLPRSVIQFWFPICAAIPTFATILALSGDLIRGRAVDWWTTFGAATVCIVWLAMLLAHAV